MSTRIRIGTINLYVTAGADPAPLSISPALLDMLLDKAANPAPSFSISLQPAPSPVQGEAMPDLDADSNSHVGLYFDQLADGMSITTYLSDKFTLPAGGQAEIVELGDDFVRVRGEFYKYDDGTTKVRTLRISEDEIDDGDVTIFTAAPAVPDDQATPFDSLAQGMVVTSYSSAKFALAGTAAIVDKGNDFVRVKGEFRKLDDDTTKVRTLRISEDEIDDGSVCLTAGWLDD